MTISYPLYRISLLEIWNSPTLMTWGSFLTKSLNLLFVIPLLVKNFTTAEISLWFLFIIFIGLQMLVDLGFSPTFIRVIAYAMGGAEVSELKSLKVKNTGQPNWKTMEQICSTMRFIYPRVNVLWTAFLVIFGTIAVHRPICMLENPFPGWASWAVILTASTMMMWGNLFSCYLQGINKIALFRRWEMIFSIGSTLTSISILLLGGGLFSMIVAHQGWQVFNIFRNRWLAGIVEEGRFKRFSASGKNEEVFKTVWPSTWRSGLGIFMSYGLVQASGIFYAQIGTSASVASYLLALRLIQFVSQFSQAPFYSKLPLFARLLSENRETDFVRLAKKGMSLSHFTFVLGFIFLGLFCNPVFSLIGANVDFPSSNLWALLGLGFFLERYGAMHIQLYSTTNDIIWHVANGVTGVLFIIFSLSLFPHFGVYAFPTAIVFGNVCFYSWYSAVHSYKTFRMDFLDFESGTTFAPLGLFLLYTIGKFFI